LPVMALHVGRVRWLVVGSGLMTGGASARRSVSYLAVAETARTVG
jgi:hypothetical protein